MNVKLKICGMKHPVNIAEVASLQPDYMGFIFYKESPRYVGEAFKMPTDFPEMIKKVGVFVNEKTEIILDHVRMYELDLVQLHGNETAEQCELLDSVGISLIKAFSIHDQFDFVELKPFERYVDFYLFDTKGKHYGGNAQVFDWTLLGKYNQRVPFFLSGGLTPENITGVKSLANFNIHALDVNSGVESEPGVKDIARINELKRAISSI